MRFGWDERKAASNRDKYRISLEDAITAFDDPFALMAADPTHSTPAEDRRWLIGEAEAGVLVVLFTVRMPGNVHRITSARRASRTERKRYEESKKNWERHFPVMIMFF